MNQIARMLPPRPRSAVVRYGAATGLVGLCFLAVLGLYGQGGILGFYLLFPAIFASAVLLDRGSGVFAAGFSTVLLYILVKPAGSILVPAELVVPLIIFLIVGLGCAVVSEGLRSAWERAAAAEQSKDLLFRELGHRTQNNLGLVISVLSLQARSKANPEIRDALEKAISRVQAISSAHEHFQALEQTGRIDMRPYLERLGTHLGDALRDVRPIAVKVEVEDMQLGTEQAVAIGLIVNELVTNALKHAFPDSSSAGSIRVVLKRGPPLMLVVEDNGVGCPLDKQERLGSRLIKLLAEQQGGKLAWEQAAPGCRVRLEFCRR